MERGEKYHIMECYLVWKPANRLPFRIQEKIRNAGCLFLPDYLVYQLLDQLKLKYLNLSKFTEDKVLHLYHKTLTRLLPVVLLQVLFT